MKEDGPHFFSHLNAWICTMRTLDNKNENVDASQKYLSSSLEQPLDEEGDIYNASTALFSILNVSARTSPLQVKHNINL